MSNVSENKLYRKSKHAIYVQYFFPWKSYRLWDNVEKYGTARRVTVDKNRAHALCMLDK